ncbi:MAG: hypothetical protein SCARUB_00647 [Candidatus Scalindua rubra]|uniref:DNA-binding protein n=1 Tax=Candidatus Scalindua rubra TaxID=1872076 RepID=A0A1E3XEV3_9BACT|nr:MAG: hypothetical protein SCARUB_00647 [Candidatus Scalindua rubra]
MKRFSMLLTLILTLITMVSVNTIYAGSRKLAESPYKHTNMKAQQDVSSLSGKVVEMMNSGGYTYVYIEKDGKKTWVVVPEMKVSVGQEISLQPGIEMANFTSKTLNRTFEKIIFSIGPISQDGAVNIKDKIMGSKDAEVSINEKIKVEKASGPNAYTVAELYEKRTKLDKKNIVVRGKVVKVSSGIMGRNWIRIQDGSGNSNNDNHTLVVTSQDFPSVGDIVTANGILYKDKDFGSGYRYDVIVEEARIKK